MTKRLVFVSEETAGMQRYYEDIERLVEVAEGAGYGLSREDAYRAWEEHSDSMCASWLTLDRYTDYDLLRILLSELEEVDA